MSKSSAQGDFVIELPLGGRLAIWLCAEGSREGDRSSDPPNEVFRWLGVDRNDEIDEFQALGLHRHRRTGDWGRGDAIETEESTGTAEPPLVDRADEHVIPVEAAISIDDGAPLPVVLKDEWQTYILFLTIARRWAGR